jgi:O-acetylhomoserine (thiol)-lyase
MLSGVWYSKQNQKTEEDRPMRDETICLHSGYAPKNTEPRVLPIVQSTTYYYDSAEDIGKVFDDPTISLIYSRFENPTVMAVEEKIAALEGGAGAMCTSSGQAATLLALLNICSAGDSFISTSKIYGGTVNLFNHTLRKMGVECIFVDDEASGDEMLAAFKPNTKAVFGEMLANPALTVLDIEKLARVAHAKNVPLIADNTFPTPVLCKPIEYGADIVVHSTSKYMDGHALQVGGVIIDSGKFDWTGGDFPGLTAPDPTYHGIIYTETYGRMAYIIKARMQLMRDFGVYPSAHSAFLLNLGLETLPLRMERYCGNALRAAQYLEASEKVGAVIYPGLPSHPHYERAKKYLSGASGVVSVVFKDGREAAVRFMDALKLATNQVHVADIRTCVLHPASTTHRQLAEEDLASAGVHPGMVRISLGLEHIDDIIEDLALGLRSI